MKRHLVLLLPALLVLLPGCATRDYVNQRVNAESQRLDADFKTRLGATDAELGRASQLAKEALERASAARQLAQGKLLYEAVLTDDSVKFEPRSAELSRDAERVLTELANKLKAENRNVFIEIQGHTDSRGTPARNRRVGRERAEAVRDFLHQTGIPLHRMSTISYGNSRPADPGNNAAARALNRRVLLVVLI